MKRRGFFQTIGAALVAAGVEREAVAAERVPVVPPPTIRKVPDFTDKQLEVLLALENEPNVLFTGHRGCGRTHMCQYVQATEGRTSGPGLQTSGRTLMVTPSHWVADQFRTQANAGTTVVWANGDFIKRIQGHRFDRIIIDDAHMLEEKDLLGLFFIGSYAAAKMFLTAMPYGPGAKMLHGLAPKEGWNGDLYRVHDPEPHPSLVADYDRVVAFYPWMKHSRTLRGDWEA